MRKGKKQFIRYLFCFLFCFVLFCDGDGGGGGGGGSSVFIFSFNFFSKNASWKKLDIINKQDLLRLQKKQNKQKKK